MMSSGEISVPIGMLPEMKTTEPYSPIARANASANPVSHAGKRYGRMTRATRGTRLAPRLVAASSTSQVEILDHRLQRADHERQADEDQRDRDAERREGDLDPVGSQRPPSQPFGA